MVDVHSDLSISGKDSNQFLKRNPSKRQQYIEFYPIYSLCCQQGRNESETECNVIDIMVGCSDEVNFEFTSTGACEMTNEIKSIED